LVLWAHGFFFSWLSLSSLVLSAWIYGLIFLLFFQSDHPWILDTFPSKNNGISQNVNNFSIFHSCNPIEATLHKTHGVGF
jgi:hypothetical protein